MFQNVTQIMKNKFFLQIPNREKCEAKSGGLWHYLAVKKTVSIIKRNNVYYVYYRDFYLLNYIHSFRKRNKLKELNKSMWK